jgi:lysozyme family protein
MATDLEYINLFNRCTISPLKSAEINRIIDNKILSNKSRYQAIRNKLLNLTEYTYRNACFFTEPEDRILDKNPKIANSFFSRSFSDTGLFSETSGIPWYFIACVHYRESNSDFTKHLHNGDPLSGFTRQHPANRPKIGHGPPFTFEESAVDALKLRGLDKETIWSLPKVLLRLEQYNGIAKAYQNNNINSPYLWGGSNLYTKGGFPRDHVFSLEYVNKQLGTAVILKAMENRGIINIPRQ